MKNKMKKSGYICIGFAALLSLIAALPSLIPALSEVKVDKELFEMLIKFWGAIMGLGLLFGNAGKRIGGQAVMNKAPFSPLDDVK